MNKISFLLSILVAVIAITQSGCGWDDEETTAPKLLSISTVSVVDSSVLISDTVAITWTANKSGCSFLYKFGETSTWSDTTELLEMDTILADGEYTFYLQAFLMDEVSPIVSRTFKVDVVGSPGIYTSPRFINLTTVSDTFSFNIRSKGVEASNAFSITLPGIKILNANFPDLTLDGSVFKSGSVVDGVLPATIIVGTRDFLTVSAVLDSASTIAGTLSLLPQNIKLSYTVNDSTTEYENISVRGSFIEVDSLSGGSN